MYPKLYAKNDEEIIDPDKYDRIWNSARATGISACHWVKVFNIVYAYKGIIVWLGRDDNDIPEVMVLNDSFARWMSRYLRPSEESLTKPAKRLLRQEALDRIRLIDLYCQIRKMQSSTRASQTEERHCLELCIAR